MRPRCPALSFPEYCLRLVWRSIASSIGSIRICEKAERIFPYQRKGSGQACSLTVAARDLLQQAFDDVPRASASASELLLRPTCRLARLAAGVFIQNLQELASR